jgi:hypothetical protein
MIDGTILVKAAGRLFMTAVAVLAFTFYYFHYSKENGLPGLTYSKKTNKPFVSMLLGMLGTVLLSASIIFLVLGRTAG